MSRNVFYDSLVMLGYVMLGQVGYVRLGQLILGQVMIGYVMLVYQSYQPALPIDNVLFKERPLNINGQLS